MATKITLRLEYQPGVFFCPLKRDRFLFKGLVQKVNPVGGLPRIVNARFPIRGKLNLGEFFIRERLHLPRKCYLCRYSKYIMHDLPRPPRGTHIHLRDVVRRSVAFEDGLQGCTSRYVGYPHTFSAQVTCLNHEQPPG